MISLKSAVLNLKCSHTIHRHASFLRSIKNYFKFHRYSPPYEHCVQVGDPVLRTVSDPVPEDVITSPEVKYVLNSMEKVRKQYGMVGISAPQIGINLRIFLICFDGDKLREFTPQLIKSKEMSLLPLTVFINPELKVLDHRKVTFEEACGSVTGYAADVTRFHSVEVTAFNEKGEKRVHTLSGWNARIAQHENDHLNGMVFTDSMDRKSFRCTNWDMVNKKAGQIEIPFYPKKKWT